MAAEKSAAVIAEKEARQQPIEVEDKRKLEQLHQKVIEHPLLRDLQVVQMDYLDLMRKVDEALRGGGEEVGDVEGGREGGLERATGLACC